MNPSHAGLLCPPIKRAKAAAPKEMSPGTKLVCIDDQHLVRSYSPAPPVRGHIYCLRESYLENGVPGVLLVGITGPVRNGLECGFLLSRFRWVHD